MQLRLLAICLLLASVVGCGPSIVEPGKAPRIDESYGERKPLQPTVEEAERRINELPGKVQWAEIERMAEEYEFRFLRAERVGSADRIRLRSREEVEGRVIEVTDERIRVHPENGSTKFYKRSSVADIQFSDPATWTISS